MDPDEKVGGTLYKAGPLWHEVFDYREADFPVGSKQMPTGCEVMRVFYFRVHCCKETISISARNTARRLRLLWVSAGKTPYGERHVLAKVMKLYNEFESLRKVHTRGGYTHSLNVRAYKQRLSEVLDIGNGCTPTRGEKRQATSLLEGCSRKKMAPKPADDGEFC